MTKNNPPNVWQDLSADWLNWADRLAAQAGKINRYLIDALNLPALDAASPGRDLQVLDLASGVGEPAFSIAQMLAGNTTGRGDDSAAGTGGNKGKGNGADGAIPAPAGRVVASDIVPGMCRGLAARAVAEGIGNLNVVTADMEALPFAARTFDAISCRFGVMFCHRPVLALAESYRVLVPGGRAGFMVWVPMADNPLFIAMDKVLRAEIGIGFDSAGLNLFGFADPETSRARMRKAGFTDISLSTRAPVGRIPENAAFWRPQMEMLFGPYLRHAGEKRCLAIDAAMRAELAQFVDEAYFRVPVCFHVLSGSRGT